MDKLNRRSWIYKWVIAGLLFVALTMPVLAATLVIDGQFGDWAGQPSVQDDNDGGNSNVDILTFYWGTNPGDDHIYWMLERESSNAKVYYFVYLDTNNDGDYTDAQDRLVQAHYSPGKNAGEVTVTILDGTGSQISTSSGDWGDSKDQGGKHAEWRASFSDLGIDAHQTVNMYAGASQNQNQSNLDRVPNDGDITWTPIPVLGWPWIAVIAAAVIGIAWYTKGRFKWRQTSSS
ncbi:MAG: hypothetical protein JXA89_09095 [Anaerolineae bacterium]|nr:hypothetical protein [Anaerolineae bacterium]